MIREKKNKKQPTKYEASVMINGRKLYQRFDSHSDAKTWINEKRYRRDKGFPAFVGKVTVDLLFNEYLKFAEIEERSPSTIIRAKQNFRMHIKPFYEDHDIRSVSLAEHESFKNVLKRKGLSPASINRARSLMLVMFNVALKRDLFGITDNPFKRVGKLKEVQKTIVYWNAEEINLFLKSEKGSFFYPLWVTWLNTGLRVGELIALDREQIDTFANILTVDRTWCDKTRVVRKATKGRGKREVGLNSVVQKVLYPCLKKGMVFTMENGKPLSHAALYKRAIPQACAKAGVKVLNPHGFRHTYGAQYMMHGGNLWDLQKQLGHSEVNVTDKFYAHFSKEHIAKRASVISLGENILKVNFREVVA